MVLFILSGSTNTCMMENETYIKRIDSEIFQYGLLNKKLEEYLNNPEWGNRVLLASYAEYCRNSQILDSLHSIKRHIVGGGNALIIIDDMIENVSVRIVDLTLEDIKEESPAFLYEQYLADYVARGVVQELKFLRRYYLNP